MSAYLLGRDDEYLQILERAFQSHLDAGQRVRAIRCAFWLGFSSAHARRDGRRDRFGAAMPSAYWRAMRTNAPRAVIWPCRWSTAFNQANSSSAYAAAADAAALGERCGDVDLDRLRPPPAGPDSIATGTGQEPCSALLDETMIAVSAGQLSPLVTGLMYCAVSAACQQVYALDRSREWTAALAQWCDEQPDMVPFAEVCQVHRAEIMQRQGAWPDAIEAARRACARSKGVSRQAAAGRSTCRVRSIA